MLSVLTSMLSVLTSMLSVLTSMLSVLTSMLSVLASMLSVVTGAEATSHVHKAVALRQHGKVRLSGERIPKVMLFALGKVDHLSQFARSLR
jgi:hypothetical protein